MSLVSSFLQETFDNIFYYGTLSLFTVHTYRAIRMITVTKKVWQLTKLENSVASFCVSCVYFTSIFSNSWIKLRQFIYGYLTSEKVQWILNSFLSLKVVCERYRNATWKFRILFGFFYFFVFWYFSNTIFYCYKLYLIPMIITSILDFGMDFIYPYKIEGFKFQNLPFPIQQRFYQLQTPLMKSRFSKSYFNFALVPYYNQIEVEKLCIRDGPKCHEIVEDFTRAVNYSETAIMLCCGATEKCTCPFPCLKKVKILNVIFAKSIKANTLSKSLSLIDYSNVVQLQFVDCSLSVQDFELISKTMKLKFLRLCLRNDGRSFDEKMVEVLEYVIGIPHLRIQYVGECFNPSAFEIFLVRWVLKNGYIKSLVCAANDSFLKSKYMFSSCPKLHMFDDANEKIKMD